MKTHVTPLVLASVTCLSSLLFVGETVAQAPSNPASAAPSISIDAATREAVINAALKALNDAYVFPEVAKKAEKSIREKLKKKQYDYVTNGPLLAAVLTADLREIAQDKHLRVRYSLRPLPPQAADQAPSPEELEEHRRFGAMVNYGFHKVERLEGNIGLLDLDGFFDAGMAGETAAAAMTFLAGADELIIDLRHNGGGDPAMVALLCSYLFDGEAVHLNDLYFREGNQTREWWTLPYVPGKRVPKKDVYVLISGDTFSGAEEFANNLKHLKRATLIGETTGGGANPGGMQRLSDHFGMFVPGGRAINPITKTNWEGTGVAPDVEVPAALALETAKVMALKKRLGSKLDPRVEGDVREALENAEKALAKEKSQLPPAVVPSVKGNTTFKLQGYSLARKVTLSGSFNDWEETKLVFAREGDVWVCRVDLPAGNHTYNFMVDGRPTLDPSNPMVEDTGRRFASVVVVK